MLRRAVPVLALALGLSTGISAAGAAPGSDPGADFATHSLRSGLTDQSFYFVMGDRFANGETANDTGGLGSDPLVSGFDPTRKGFYQGGDLKGLQSRLDYI